MPADPYRYFRIEARELIESMAAACLSLEKGADCQDAVSSLLRSSHTLKGAARVVRLLGIADLTHTLEGKLLPHRDHASPMPAPVFKESLALVDAITALVLELEATPSPPLAPGPPAVAPPAPLPVLPAGPLDSVDTRPPMAPFQPAPPPRPAMKESVATVRVEVSEVEDLLTNLAEATTQVASFRTELDGLDRSRQLCALIVEQLERSLVGEVGDVTRTLTRLSRMAEDLDASLKRIHPRLVTTAEQADRELGLVHERAVRLRLLPARSIFLDLERACRDAAELLGKDIEFGTTGGHHRVDAQILTIVRSALNHVVRNAVAHGIEPREARERAGKPSAGQIRVDVERHGKRILFTVTDDGAGLDLPRIHEVAVARHLVPAAAVPMDHAAAVQLLLRGGISTSAVTDAVSGRGVGMNVLQEAARELKGDLTLRSDPGAGTTVGLSVRLTLSSIAALKMTSRGSTTFLPLSAVDSVVLLATEDAVRGAHSDGVRFGGRLLAYRSLGQLLEPDENPEPRSTSVSAVIVSTPTGAVALGVDALHGICQIMVRPLPGASPAHDLVAGVSLSTAGLPQLVLDPAGVAAAIGSSRHSGRAPEARVRLPVLVVDDSLTTRMLEQSILETAGYDVDLACSGEEGLERARSRRYGLFVVDVEMPGMSGFDFVGTTRQDPVLGLVPAIMVTSLSEPAHRARAFELGASDYIVKGEFDQTFLLDRVRQLVG